MGTNGDGHGGGTKNATGGAFFSGVVDGTIWRGRGRVLGPVEVLVSTLDTWVVGRDVLMNWTYQN
jgi:hypothetical protein